MSRSILETLSLQKQAEEYLPHILVGRLRPELGNGQGIGRRDQVVNFVIVWEVKADLHSMHRRAFASVGRPRHAVSLGAQLLKDFQHRFFGRINKGPLRDGGGVLQQGFGFGDFFHAASLRGSVLNSTQALLTKVVLS